MTEREISCTHAAEIIAMKEQIKTLFKLTDDFSEMVKNITILTENMTFIKGDVEEIKEKFDEVKQEKIEDFRHYKRLVFGCIITAIVGFLVGRFIKGV